MDEPKLTFVALNINGGQTNMTADDTAITICPDSSYCCGFNNTACCIQQSGYWIKDGKVFPYNQNPFSTSSPTSPSSSPIGTATATRAASQTSKSAQSNKHATSIGLGVGLGVGIPVLLAISLVSCFCLRRRSRSTAAPAGEELWDTQAKKEGIDPHGSNHVRSPAVELPVEERVQEM